MLPQQSLMLRVAAEAIRDAGWDPKLALRTGVLIGIGLDLNTTNFHLRWSLADRAGSGTGSWVWACLRGALARWVEELREAAGPPLTANRTMGSLGGLVASRIAREFRIGGPSFTVSCDETSGIQALAIAVEWLRRGELDAAIVGAVDFAGDPRAVLARRRLQRESSGSTSSRPDRVGFRRGRLPGPETARRRTNATAIGSMPDPSGPRLPIGGWLADWGWFATPPIPPDRGRVRGRCSGGARRDREGGSLPPSPDPAVGPHRGPTESRTVLAEEPCRGAAPSGSPCIEPGRQCLHVILEEPPSPEFPPPSLPRTGATRSARAGWACSRSRPTTTRDSPIASRNCRRLGRESPAEPIDSLARRWWRRHPNDPRLRLGAGDRRR